jgi:tetratricopeptide (TPR) repeat protein
LKNDDTVAAQCWPPTVTAEGFEGSAVRKYDGCHIYSAGGRPGPADFSQGKAPNPILSVLRFATNGAAVEAQNKLRTAHAVLFFLFLLSCLLSPLAYAEIIQLKNGNAIETKILKENEEFVIVEAPGGKVKIPKSDIQTIWRGSKEELLEVRGKEVYFAKGVELYKSGQFLDAADAFENAMVPGGENTLIHVNLGSAYASAGDREKAEKNFLTALDQAPKDPDLLLNLAHLYESGKDFKKAALYYQQAVDLKPEAMQTKRNLAYCLYMTGDYPGAAKLFEALGKKNDVVASCNAATAYIQAGELDQASAILGQLLESSFPVPRTYLLMAEVSRLRKDHSGAAEYYEKALKNDPDVEKVKLGLGQLYLATGEWDKAEATFQEVLTKERGSRPAARGLAQAFTGKGEFQKAIDQYEKLAGKDPADPAILGSIGRTYLKMNKPQAALETFQKIFARNNRDAKAHTNAGLAYAFLGDADNALREWDLALELDPKLSAAARNKKLLEEALQGNRNEETLSK